MGCTCTKQFLLFTWNLNLPRPPVFYLANLYRTFTIWRKRKQNSTSFWQSKKQRKEGSEKELREWRRYGLPDFSRIPCGVSHTSTHMQSPRDLVNMPFGFWSGRTQVTLTTGQKPYQVRGQTNCTWLMTKEAASDWWRCCEQLRWKTKDLVSPDVLSNQPLWEVITCQAYQDMGFQQKHTTHIQKPKASHNSRNAHFPYNLSGME